MRPDRMGKSKWVKVLPWYYTRKRQPARQAVERQALAVAYDDCGHDDMALGVGPNGRYWFCPECGWAKGCEHPA